MTKFRIKHHMNVTTRRILSFTKRRQVGTQTYLKGLKKRVKIIEEGLERLSREGGEKKCMHDLIEKEFRMGKWEPSDTHDCSELCEDKSHKPEDEKCKCGCPKHDGICCTSLPQPPQWEEEWQRDFVKFFWDGGNLQVSKGIQLRDLLDFIRTLLKKTREEVVGKEVYAWETDKKCELYLDHNPQWCGDCFACSECGLKFSADVAETINGLRFALKDSIEKEKEAKQALLAELKGEIEKLPYSSYEAKERRHILFDQEDILNLLKTLE